MFEHLVYSEVKLRPGWVCGDVYVCEWAGVIGDH